MGKLRYVVEQAFALLPPSSASPSAGNAAPNFHDAFISLACGLICRRRLKKSEP
ncbi:hypothetical protein [Streptomyces sp. TP-A0874]|uniref:hypothetical protein n=1 Tax=Streptomyces sp. TP-A0874 TaxID=549819 RepID=UPI0014809F51|nr:hypothetical protein [Streptomyces sp. TP-A0874]